MVVIKTRIKNLQTGKGFTKTVSTHVNLWQSVNGILLFKDRVLYSVARHVKMECKKRIIQYYSE